jgi:hypothetical protein
VTEGVARSETENPSPFPSPAPSPLRFCGNGANPNHAAVLHLLRTYAAHLGLGLIETTAEEADVVWARPAPSSGSGPFLAFPGRAEAAAEFACVRTRGGYPVPLASVPLSAPAWDSGEDGGIAAPEDVLDGAEGRTLAWRGSGRRTLVAEWDLLSFCADLLFRRADHHPSRASAAREGAGVGQWDQAFGLLEEPWVDRWMFRLLGELPRFRGAIAALARGGRIWLTHDLDNLAKWRFRSLAGQVLRTPMQLARLRFPPLIRAWSEIAARGLGGRDPFDVMDRVFAMEAGRRSANFFLATPRDHVIHRYDIAKPRYRKALRECLDHGMDVGLHGQVHWISDPAAIRRESDKLGGLAGRPMRLNRQHYLRWDPAVTFAGLEAAGIQVDSTLGYNDSPGFRTGSAFPFLWFDCAAGKPTRLLEVPLILGEFQFFQPQAFDGDEVRRTLRRYLDAATRQGGVFTVLFHNQYFHEGDFPGVGAVYRDLLGWAAERGLPDFDPEGTHARYVGMDAGG